MTNFTNTKRLMLVAMATAAVSLSPAAAQAGFLDQLFGGGDMAAPAPMQQPSAGYNPDSSNLNWSPVERSAPRAKRKVVAHVEKTPNLQKTTDLMSDKTLRPGDAVMMKTGVHVFDGAKTSHHDSDEFVALDKAEVSKKARTDLAAMDVTRRAPASLMASAGVQEGRSSSGQALTQGYRITDAQGRSVRYVGP